MSSGKTEPKSSSSLYLKCFDSAFRARVALISIVYFAASCLADQIKGFQLQYFWQRRQQEEMTLIYFIFFRLEVYILMICLIIWEQSYSGR
jgi:hypothetical protein